MRVLIIDDHALFREATALILGRLDEHVAVFEAGTADEAFRLVAHYRELDIILLDLALPELGGLDAIPHFLDMAPTTPIVVVSGSEDMTLVQAVIDAGASGFIPKSASSHEFLSALRIIFEGNIFLPTRFLGGALPVDQAGKDAAPEEPEATPAANPLTERQQHVLLLLAEGLPNKLIARELGVSDATVKLHVSAILRELGVRNRTEAVVLATQLGLLKPKLPL